MTPATRVLVDTTISAAGTAVIQGTSFGDAWKENLLVSLGTSAVFGSIGRYAAAQAKLEGKIATTWAQASKAGKAWIATKEIGSLTAHTLWGAAMGTVAGKIVTGKSQPPPATLREWALQGVSVAVGKHVSQRLTSRSKAYKALEEHFEDKGRGLTIAAGKLQALAKEVISGQKPDKALSLLEQHDQFLKREVKALDDAIARAHKANKPTDDLYAARENLKLAAEAAGADGMLETKFALIGMEELVPGALWKGTDAQIKQAVQQAKSNPKARVSQDPKTKRWKLRIGDQKLEIEPVKSTNGEYGAHPVPNSNFTGSGKGRTPFDQDHLARQREGCSGDPELRGRPESQRACRWRQSAADHRRFIPDGSEGRDR